jgi:transposase
MRTYKIVNRDQLLLFPPNLNDWIPANHPVRFVLDVIQKLNLKDIYEDYETSKGGAPPYDPAMMLGILLYGYMMGVTTSRKLEQAIVNDIGFRYLTGNRHLDHDTIANFRKRHSERLPNIFAQVVAMAVKINIVRLGHVAIDGSKIRSNASRWQRKTEEELLKQKQSIKQYFQQCDEEDADEDAEFGKGKNGYMLPESMANEQVRQQWIDESLKELAREAEQAEDESDEKKGPKPPLEKKLEKVEQTLKALKTQKEEEKKNDPTGKLRRKRERNRGAKQEPKINQTDFDSRIMRFGDGRYNEGYNCQIAVDDWEGIIVAADVTQEAADQRQLRPMVLQVQSNTGWLPDNVTADNGYFNTEHIEDQRLKSIEFYVNPNNSRHEKKPNTKSARMRDRLATEVGRRLYNARKTVVEPVFGIIKHARRFRQFQTRGKPRVKGEWMLWCTAYNMLKLLRQRGNLTLALA